MKRLILSLLITFCSALSVQALSYSDARREAWFLTDKMAYELNLTPEQCDVVYQINLDYFLSIRRASDCRGPYWNFRNDDFRFVLSPWQFNIYISIDYFYYPIRWVRSAWYYPVVHYYRRDYYYFDRPTVYAHYRGSSWTHRSSRSRSPYRNVTFSHSSAGMRDRYYGNDSRRPTHRVDYGTPSSNSSNRPSRTNSGREQRESHNNVSVHSDRDRGNGRPANRYDRGNRGSNTNNAVRPSREYGKDRGTSNNTNHTRVNRTENRDKNTSGGHGERNTREFGR